MNQIIYEVSKLAEQKPKLNSSDIPHLLNQIDSNPRLPLIRGRSEMANAPNQESFNTLQDALSIAN